MTPTPIDGPTGKNDRDRLSDQVRRLVEAADALQQAEAEYRRLQADPHSDPHEISMAWVRMRQAGDTARVALQAGEGAQPVPTDISGSSDHPEGREIERERDLLLATMRQINGAQTIAGIPGIDERCGWCDASDHNHEPDCPARLSGLALDAVQAVPSIADKARAALATQDTDTGENTDG